MVEFFIDGDACPVKNEVIRVAERHKIKINVASNSWLRFSNVMTEINQIILPKTPDAADNWIADNVKPYDIIITSDIPLAERCLKAGAFAIRPNGNEFTKDNIGFSLGMRDFNNFLREIGEKGNIHSSFSAKDRSNFLSALEVLFQKSKRHTESL